MDVTKRDQVKAGIAATVAEFGKLDAFFNNAGMNSPMKLLDVTEENFNLIMRINVLGVLIGMQEAAKQFIAQGSGGKIINTASISGHIVNRPQSQSHYNAAKSAVLGFTRSLAVEWAPKGIRVNSISPTYTRTSLVDDLLKSGPAAEHLPLWLAATPMNALADPTDIQGAAVYLASRASDFVTGIDLAVDGGYMAV
jgi:meso-butanediol dehydrogenase/(S,S)-butanediol dehydrogenase/diacetyl reductase